MFKGIEYSNCKLYKYINIRAGKNPGIIRNHYNLLKNAEGKYIANCDGDDCGKIISKFLNSKYSNKLDRSCFIEIIV
jgi:hypothetical protein